MSNNVFGILLTVIALFLLWMIWVTARAELVDNGNCVYLKEALQSFQGRELTAQEMLVLKKLEEWWVRADCDQAGNRPR